MNRVIATRTVAVVLAACEPVTLRVEDLRVPPTTPAPIDRTIDPVAPPEASACTPRCVGGRSCSSGECVPHWLPIHAPEVSRAVTRMHPFAVWTGDEVIVWGGHNPDAPAGHRLHGDGYRFNPRRSEVRPLTLRLAPSPRFATDGQAAIWTGREMVIWGGHGDDGALTDGAAYTPSLDRWAQFSNAMAPLAHVAPVLTSTGVVLSGTSVPGDSWRWEPSLGTWERLSSAVAPASMRRGQSAVWTGSELLVWGGIGGDGRALADGWRSSPQRRRSLAMRSEGAPEARSMHSATWSTSEMLIFGGRDTRGAALGTLASYVPASNTWREVSSQGAPSPRWGHVAVWTGHALLVWGGTQGANVFADGGSYDPWDDAWRPIPAPRDVDTGHARYGAAAVWTGEELIVMGGSDGTPTAGPLGWRYQP